MEATRVSTAAPPQLPHRRRSALLALVLVVVTLCTVTLVLLQPRLTIGTQSSLRHSPQVELLQATRNTDEESPQTKPPATPPPTKSPAAAPSSEEKQRKQREQWQKRCYDERDYGMIPVIQQTKATYCTNATGVEPALGKLSTYTHYDSRRADLKSTLITNLWVDLRNAEVFKQIQNVSQDGHRHDPRFKHSSVDSYCVCNAPQDQSLAKGVRVWGYIHGDHPWGKTSDWRFCHAIQTKQQVDELTSGVTSEPWNKTLLESVNGETSGLPSPPHPAGWPYKVRRVKTNAIIIGRRDDHNPFFQISVAMNAWIMMKVLNWTPEATQLVYFDDGFPSVTDELQRRVLAPVNPPVRGRELVGSVLHFDQALVAPFEFMGPFMRHLNNNEPCRRNQLVNDFRDMVMSKYGVAQTKTDPASCTITVIARRPYAGRMVQRKWLNEDAILQRMREDYRDIYKYGSCKFQSLDFVELSLAQQMRTIVESDVIIGMHGAGMVNVLWARPEMYVAEIFPLRRKRWGYRNICYFIGCKWSQFRGGKDTGKGENSSDKLISYADWFGYFDPVIRDAVRALEARVSGNF